MQFNAEIKQNRLVITIPLEKPHPSVSGKTLVVASTHGTKVTTAKVKGKAVVLNVNAFIYQNEKGPHR